MSQQPSLDQLLALINKQKAQGEALGRVAQTQVTNQPWRKPGDTQGTMDYMRGRGVAPEQSRGLNQLYGSILNRDKTKQTAIGAATGGFERGSQLIDEIRAKQKGEQVDAAKTQWGATGQDIDNMLKTFGVVSDEEKRKIDAYKAATAAKTANQPKQVTFDGKVYNQYPDGRLELLGASEGQMGRQDEERVRQDKIRMDKEALARAQKATAEAGTASAGQVLNKLQDISKNVTGWTTGVAAGIGRHKWGSDARAQEDRIESLKANLAINKLQEMRAAADNGASGFGQLTKNEFDALMNSIDTLSVTQSKERQLEAIENIRKYYWKALADYEPLLASDPTRTRGGKSLEGYSPEAQEYLRKIEAGEL